MQHLEYLLYSFDNQRVYSYFHSTFLIYFLMEAGLPIIVHFLVADSSQKKRTFSMEDYLSADFWGQDSKKAFRYLYDKYTATLRYFASRYLEDDAVIEDVVQDAFLNLWEKRGTFQAENAVKAYLYKVVRSLSVDAIRRRRVIDRYNDYAIREEEDQEFFLENILESEVFLLVQSVFDELSPACREVYQLSLNGKHFYQYRKKAQKQCQPLYAGTSTAYTLFLSMAITLLTSFFLSLNRICHPGPKPG